MFSFDGLYATPHHTFPFNQPPCTDDIRREIERGIQEEKVEIDTIIAQAEAPTFENTIKRLESSGTRIERATTYLYTMLGLDTCDELEGLANEISPILSNHELAIMHNRALLERVVTVYKDCAGKSMDDEDRMLLEKTYESFERSGALLPPDKAKRYSEISERLATLTLKFSQNLLKETNAFVLHLTQAEDLDGLPERVKEQARETACERGLDGWVFTLHAPSYGPFLTYSTRRDLRHRLYMAQNTKCIQGNEYDNTEIVREIVNLRLEKAQLLGYKTYADMMLKYRMAGSRQAVKELLDSLLVSFRPKALTEIDDISAQARQAEGPDFTLEPWDYAHYAHLLNKERYGIDAETLRPYFQQDKVVSGVFGLAHMLYGISFKENVNIPVYHADVKAFEVYDSDGSFLGVLYLDLFPRESKQSGAWMTNFKEEWDMTSRPHIVIAANLTKPTAETPSLLSLSEVETLLHEFGHALHGLFAMTRYKSLSGTNVLWDFVELPSQIMENFAVEKDFLRTFAQHYQTGKPIPDELLSQVVASRNADAGYACLRQISFGLLDMAFYEKTERLTEDIREFEHQAWQATAILPQPVETCMSVQFSHIMAGGYSAGYYSYKWAEVLEADAFRKFKEEGIFNREVADSFRRNILAQGGTRPPMELYTAFRGKRPDIHALLVRCDLPTTAHDMEKWKKQHDLDCRYLRMAHLWAENSYCERRQVGALIVKDKMIISDGYNGTPSGFENICENTEGMTKPYVLHAEANAITKIARSNNNSDGATLYVTDAPCIECSKLIIQSGIRRVIYARPYRLRDGIDLLRKAGIEVSFMPYIQ